MKLRERLQSIMHAITHAKKSLEHTDQVIFEKMDTHPSNTPVLNSSQQRTVDQLTKDELDELRTALYYKLSSNQAAEYFDASDIPDSTLKEHYADTTFVHDDFSCNVPLEPYINEDFSQTRSPAKLLPASWEWVKYNDGSGHLEGPQGQQLFSYDLVPYANTHGVEFKETADGAWSVYWNDENQDRDFWKYAEEQVLLQHTPQQEFPVVEPTPSYEPEM